MRRDRWNQIRELLAELLEQPLTEREALLARASQGDPELRREVESLLAQEAEDGFLRPPSAEELARGLAPESAADPLGERVGPWTIERRLAAGGMGVVYLGTRSDGRFEQRVAVKVIKRGMDTEAILERFDRERRLLASLEHPGIARLLDGGALADGRPYLVMEYVEGAPIDCHCATRALDLRARLELFLAVCDAVAHAHQRLVVHRDLKPGNVLVTPDGQPKLCDFGLARLVAPDGRAETYELTAEGERLLTPNYAAPEQLRGEPVTTATDVYALGVVLYELLAGRRPYSVEELGWPELERTVCQLEPPPPSRAAREVTGTRARRLEGDLDTIVLTALRKEPERRYASVAALADDVRRHVSGHPIAARPDSVVYRTAKFVRRNRGLVASASVVLVASLMGVAGVLLQARAARRAEEEAVDRHEQVLRLSALQELADLEARAGALWPVATERIDGYRAWIADAQRLREQFVVWRTEREALRTLALPRGEAARAAERASHPALSELQSLELRIELARARLSARRDGEPAPPAELELARYPDDPEVLRRYALELVGPARERLGEERRGLALALRLVGLAPESWRAWATLGEARAALGDDEAALDAWLRAAELAPASALDELEPRIAEGERVLRTATSSEGVARAEAELTELEARRADLSARVEERRDWRFPPEHAEARWWHAQLTLLIEGVEALFARDTGLASDEGASAEHGWSVPRRLRAAETWRDDAALAAAWARALPELERAYGGLALAPQTGLAPLGPDPVSGLWELADLATGAPPERGADGALQLEEDSGVVFVLLPGGECWLGAQARDPRGRNYDPAARNSEGPVHRALLSPFLIAKHELTQAQWRAMTGANPSYHQPPFPLTPSLRHPVEHVSWEECARFCERLGWRLPSEAEWEHAARAGTDTPWWSGAEREQLASVAQVNLLDRSAVRHAPSWGAQLDWPGLDDGFPLHAPVDAGAPNPFGLLHVHGNVAEWCRDAHDVLFYAEAPALDPANEDARRPRRVLRGGSFYTGAALARSAARLENTPAWRDGSLGLRPARSLERTR